MSKHRTNNLFFRAILLTTLATGWVCAFANNAAAVITLEQEKTAADAYPSSSTGLTATLDAGATAGNLLYLHTEYQHPISVKHIPIF